MRREFLLYERRTATGEEWPIAARKRVEIAVDLPGDTMIRGNRGDHRPWMYARRLMVLWDRTDLGWTVENVQVYGITSKKYQGYAFAYFDMDGPRVPKWIPPLVDMFRPCDEEVMAEWETLEL